MGWARNQGLRRMANAGHVTGIRDVTQGRGLDIKPYGLFTAQASPGRGVGSFDRDGNAGVDLFYNPTPLLRAVFTVNTDFAQTEVDQRQVNLTRFSLFFPERRDFFLDGATFFDFGSPLEDTDLRITPVLQPPHRPERERHAAADQLRHQGHRPDGRPGRRPASRADRARRRRWVHRRGLHGGASEAPAARRSPTSARSIRAATQRLDGARPGIRPASISAWPRTASSDRRISRPAAGSCTPRRPGLASGTNAFGGSLAYPERSLERAGSTRARSRPNFDPAVGFVTRRNYRRYSPKLALQPRPAGHRYIRQFSFGGRSTSRPI